MESANGGGLLSARGRSGPDAVRRLNVFGNLCRTLTIYLEYHALAAEVPSEFLDRKRKERVGQFDIHQMIDVEAERRANRYLWRRERECEIAAG